MATLEEVAQFLGLSKRAVRARVDALGEMLDGYLTRGERNRLIFKGEAVVLLRRLEELRRRERIPIQQAADRLKGELDGADDEAYGAILNPQVEIALLHEVIRELCQERDRWREVAVTIRSILPSELAWLGEIFPAVPGDRRLN